MELLDFLNDTGIAFERNASLSKKSWIRTGGNCAIWICPQTVQQLETVCRYLYTCGMEFDIVGQTSNLFFHSTYSPQIVVSTIHVNKYNIQGNILTCDCGVSVVKLAKDCLSQGYAGFYGLVGLPGTIASAVYNNSSCFNCSISSMLIDADVLMPDGTIRTMGAEDFKFTHRSSAFKRGERKGIILRIKLRIQKAEDISDEYRKSEDAVTYRRDNQERQAGKTLGSVFASRPMKRNFRNKIVNVAKRILPGILKCQPRYIQKKAILLLYGYRELDRYTSDRQINTFIWKDEKAEEMFERYKEMMNKVYDNPIMEIEEKY